MSRFPRSRSKTPDDCNDLQAAHNWFRCLKDLFNKFSAEFNQNRSNDSAAKRRTPEIRADYILQIDSLEQQIKNLDLVTLRNLLSINGACLRLCCFGDPWLEQKVVENEAAVELLRYELKKIDVFERDKKWIHSVKELVADNFFAWGTQTIVEILEYDRAFDELIRLSDEDLGFLIKVISCIESWPLYMGGYQIDKCQKICEVLVKVINKSYWPCVKSGDGKMSALENELAECAAKTLENIITQRQAQNYTKDAFILIKLCLDSFSDITKTECNEDNKNEAIAVNIYMLIRWACRRHMDLILSGVTTTDPEYSELYGRVVAEMLQATNKTVSFSSDKSCSKVAMDFWFSLAFHAYNEVEWEEEQEHCTEKIKPLYVHLTHIFLNRGQWPDEEVVKTWTKDHLENFQHYRDSIDGALKATYDIIQNTMLEILSSLLDEGVTEFKSNPMSWAKLEVSIFGFNSIAEYVAEPDSPIETDKVPKLMRTLTEIPYDEVNEKLLEMALKAVGSYRYWLKKNPSFIPTAIQLLVMGSNSGFFSEAISGITELCTECQIQMKPYAESLLESIFSGGIKGLNEECLTTGIAKLMSVLPEDKINKNLDIIINPYIEELQKICQTGEKNPTTKNMTISRLKLMSSLFKSLNIKVENYECTENIGIQPVLTICQKNMPLFWQMAEFWKDDKEVVETICFTLSDALTNLDEDFKPMLEEFCSFLVSVYQRKPCETVLNVSKKCLRVFGLDEDTKQLKQQMLSQIVFYTFKLLEETPDDEFSKIVEMVEQFRNWMTELIDSHIDLLLGISIDYSKLISYIFKLLVMSENTPVSWTAQFLKILILKSRNHPDMTQAVLDQGEAIVRNICLFFACPNTRSYGANDVENFADVLQTLNNNYHTEFEEWVKILNTPNFPTALSSEEDKKKFVVEISKPDSNKNHIRLHAREFAAKCRGIEQI